MKFLNYIGILWLLLMTIWLIDIKLRQSRMLQEFLRLVQHLDEEDVIDGEKFVDEKIRELF